jgi:hypothetical protein
MNIEILITIFTIIIIPFCKWYLDLKLEEQTEELNKIIGVNNDINNALKQQLSKIIDQFNMFNKRYENDVRIVKRKLFKDDESISRKDFK